jgi:hypothetical protein
MTFSGVNNHHSKDEIFFSFSKGVCVCKGSYLAQFSAKHIKLKTYSIRILPMGTNISFHLYLQSVPGIVTFIN